MKFSEQIIDQLGEGTNTRILEAGDVLVEQGSEATEVFYLRSGRLIVTIAGPAGPLIVGQVEAGELMGEVAVVAGRPRMSSISQKFR